jgi:DNA ligase-1
LRNIFPSYETNLKKFISSDSTPHLTAKGVVETTTIQMLPQLPFTEEMFGAMSGLMIRKDAPYQGKRSNDLLKVKKFETEEYKVEDVVFGPIMVINEDSGLQETIEALVSVVINHKGLNTLTNAEDTKVINVGSGFSQQERVEFYNHPERIKGKVISVQFFETIRSKDGKESLRFPTFKGIHGNKRVL